MLDFNSISFEFLTKSYNTSRALLAVGFILLLFGSLYILHKVLDNGIKWERWIIIVLITLIVCSPALITYVNVPFCRAVVKVEPSEEISIEYMQEHNSFVKKDGEMFFVKTFSSPVIISKDYFEDKSYIKKEIQKDLDKIISKKWIEENRIK